MGQDERSEGPTEFRSCIGILPEGGEMVMNWIPPQGAVVYYCKKCRNPLGWALPPEVSIVRWSVGSTIITKEAPRRYPRYALCGRCITVREIDWGDCPEILNHLVD